MKKNTRRVVSLLGFSLALVVASSAVAFAAGPAPVNLLSAGNFVVLSKSGITTTGATFITGDIGVSPIAATAMTGFGLIMDSSNTFSKSSLVSGKVFAADYSVPTPSTMTTAVNDMQTAYTDAAGRTLPTATELGAGNIGGLTIAPGLYKWGTSVTIPTDVTLAGGANDVWIFQIDQNLDISSAKNVILSGGAQAGNIFWVVAGQTTLGTNSVFNGNILDKTAIVMNTGSTLDGSALAQTAITLDASKVTKANVSVSVPVSTPAPVITPTPAPVITTSSIITPLVVATATTQILSTVPAVVTPTVNYVPIKTTVSNVVTKTVITKSASVNSPKLPNTGFATEKNGSISFLAILAGIFAVTSIVFLSQRKQKIQ